MAIAHHSADPASASDRGSDQNRRRDRRGPPAKDRTSVMVARLIREWARPYWRMILINFALIALFALSNAAYPILISKIVDALDEDVSASGWIIFAVVGVALWKGGTLFLHKRMNNRIFAAIAMDLQRAQYAKMIAADMSWHGREPAAALTQRITADVDQVQKAMMLLVNNLLRDGLTLIALIGGMFYIDWRLALLALIFFPLALWPIVRIGQVLRKIGRPIQEQIAGVTALLQETLAGVRVAKTYRLEAVLKRRTDAQFDRLRSLNVRAADHTAAVDPLMEVIGGLMVAGVLLFVSTQIESGRNSFGDIAGFLAALLMAAQPARALGNVNAKVQRALAGARRVFDLLDEAPRVVDAPGARPLEVKTGAIAFDQVTFRYADETAAALDGLSLDAPGGARVALVGRSGAGKSTLFHMIPRLYDPTAGAIRIDGQDLKTVTLASLRDHIAVVTQDAVLFNDTVRANIAYGRDAGRTVDDAAIEQAARDAAAHDFIMALPNGYDTVIGDRGDRLSGGQRQRLSIARAFLRDAPILLLDEATSALDAESEHAIKSALDRLAVGRTTLIIAHRLSTIRDADLIAVLDQGRLVELGPHDALIGAGGLYAHLFDLQFSQESPPLDHAAAAQATNPEAEAETEGAPPAGGGT